jgi:beta-glucosidase
MKSKHPDFTPLSPAIEQRITDILNRLTLEEKIDFLGGEPDVRYTGYSDWARGAGKSDPANDDPDPRNCGDTRGNARVGIPPLKFADASVGIHWWTDRSTTYPATIALAAAWDPDLAYRAGAALGRDSRARGIHVVLGPGVNLYRSALCGRNFEYMGEDPCLASRSVVAFIRGLQDQGVAATVKHLAVNYQEWNRHHVSSDVDERTLREVYLPAFRAAVEEAGSAAVMMAYNLVNGVHASEHDFLIRQVLKGEWGFQGLAMSDWISTYSAVNAANAGLDLEMPSATWLTRERLLPAVQNGLVDESVIDDKVRRLLRLMCCFGWLDRPQWDATIPLEDPDSAAVALEVARRGCVLLKNEGALLPLDPASVKTIALVGPGAVDTPIGGGGSAYNQPWRKVGILEGLRQQFGAERVVHHAGILPLNQEAAFAASRYETADGQTGLQAEYFNNPDWKGTPVLNRVEPRLEQRWGGGVIAEGVEAASFSARWTGFVCPGQSGTHLFHQWSMAPFRVRVDGQILFDLLDGADVKPPCASLTLEAGRRYPVEVLYRSTGADGNGIAVGWEFRDLDAERSAAVELARGADVAIFCGGHSQITESEGTDREFAIPDGQEELLLAVAAANPRVVAVITAGGNVDMRRWIDEVPALLHAWYPGQEGGTAIAEILSGAVNPSGRLPATFERALEDRSSFDCYHAPQFSGPQDYRNVEYSSRVALSDGVFFGYRHHDRTGVAPLFPFGFGLSYTTFAYENLVLPGRMNQNQPLVVQFDVVNTGKRAGIETPQLYLGDAEASVPRPVKELKGFASVALAPGERRTVELAVTERDLQFFCPRRRSWVAEPGAFTVSIGASAEDIRLTGTFMYLGDGQHPAAY